jgi:hypothetical protein
MINERDSLYRQKYIDTISSADSEYLFNVRELLAFGDGKAGNLAPMFLFFPLFVRPENNEEIHEYYSLLSDSIISGDITRFLEKYVNYKNELKSYWVFPVNFEEHIIALKTFEEEISTISSIIINNYNAFLQYVWPNEKYIIAIQIERLQPLIDEGNFIRRWEEFTGFVFKSPIYEISLSTSLGAVSNAVSAGYGRNNFYYFGDTESFLVFISHEVGTHILIRLMDYMEELSEKYGFTHLYWAYETLAAYYNKKIAGKMHIDVYDSETFFIIYREIEENYPGINALELLKMGLEKYTSR